MFNAVHLVLVNLCQQLGVIGQKDEEHESNNDDAKIFNSLLIEPPDESELHGTEFTRNENMGNGNEDEAVDIFEVMSQIIFPANDHFHGACIDSGAQHTVIGKQQAELYAQFADVNIAPSGSRRVYRFGNVSHECCSEISIRLPINLQFFSHIQVEVVPVNILFLLGLDLLTKFKIIIDFDGNIIRSKLDCWVLPIVRKLGHAYVEWEISAFYTETELRRLQRHFYHPQTERLFALIKGADPTREVSEIHVDLERIKATCDVCQREADMPHRFRVALPIGECTFNKTISLNKMKLDGRSVLQAVGKDTRFSAARFFSGESTKDFWEAFLCIWVGRMSDILTRSH